MSMEPIQLSMMSHSIFIPTINSQRTSLQKEKQECDIETMHQESRGTKRLVYSNNFDIYYTEDHYNTFIKVYSGEGQ